MKKNVDDWGNSSSKKSTLLNIEIKQVKEPL